MSKKTRKRERLAEAAGVIGGAILQSALDGEEVLASAVCSGHFVSPVGHSGTDVGQLLLVTPTKLLEERFLREFKQRWSMPSRKRRDRTERRKWLATHLSCVIDVTWDGLYAVYAGDTPGPVIVAKHVAS